ncbi:lipopolysaccharide biosynthesis protein [Paenibacillus sp. MWE-103]|uniref:Lipopolysaccharide biosynthesis protein n=1 Tax=Paenibacillus artemisiicola TaxID=1172618 RepID=A0ABS3WHK6_9BACL|nr:lipopolysaccharide biosynthesis protein [Paenibacillus artemisiicola]MBO7747804.1 lipopolysaccharide biosynthesis protein [Paenibacillus artemisiicola]
MNATSLKRAALINFISKYTVVIIQILFTSVLARLLTPEDFGIVAVTTVFTTFFLMIADMGIGAAIIQNKSLTKQDVNHIFTFTIYFAVILAVTFALFSVPLSYVYGNSVYITIGAVLSVSLFFNALNIVPNALLLKDKRFAALGVRSIIVSIAAAALTIVLAVAGYKYYAIVYNSVFMAFFTFLWNILSVSVRPALKFNKASIIKIKEFSTFQFLFNLVNYFSRNLDALLIGKFLGSVALGYYDKGYRLMLYPLNILTGVITPILLPILSEHQENKDYIYSQYMRIVKLLSLMGAFVSVFCFVSAKEIITIMFGASWLATVPAFKMLALSVWPQMVTSSTGAIFQSLGSTKLLFKTGVINSLITVISICVGIWFKDIRDVALCVSIAYTLHFFIAFFILVRYGFERRYTQFLRQFFPDLLVFVLTFAGLLLSSFVKIDNVIFTALFMVMVAGIAFFVGLVITNQISFLFSLGKSKRKDRIKQEYDPG